MSIMTDFFNIYIIFLEVENIFFYVFVILFYSVVLHFNDYNILETKRFGFRFIFRFRIFS